jgi:hypothetical protein
MSPLVGVGFFGLAGAYGSWRTQRWAGGFVAALGTFFVVWLFMVVWWNATLYTFAQVPQSNPYWIQGVAMEHASRASAFVFQFQSRYAR